MISLIICNIWHTQRKRLISREMKSYEGFLKKNVCTFITTCRQLLKLRFFSPPKMLDFLILNWGKQLTRTKQLIDCGLSAKLATLLHLTFFQNSIVLYVLTFHTNFIVVAQCYPIWQN